MITIKVYGTGCARCRNLEQLCAETVEEMKIEAEIEKVTDIEAIVKSGMCVKVTI